MWGYNEAMIACFPFWREIIYPWGFGHTRDTSQIRWRLALASSITPSYDMFVYTFALMNVFELWWIRRCRLGRTSKTSFFGSQIRHGTPSIPEIHFNVLSNVADHMKFCGFTTERKLMFVGAFRVDLSCKSPKKCIFCSPEKGCAHYMFWQLRILEYFIFPSFEN